MDIAVNSGVLRVSVVIKSLEIGVLSTFNWPTERFTKVSVAFVFLCIKFMILLK